jgi:hypothetical protein
MLPGAHKELLFSHLYTLFLGLLQFGLPTSDACHEVLGLAAEAPSHLSAVLLRVLSVALGSGLPVNLSTPHITETTAVIHSRVRSSMILMAYT